ncbi:MerR family transcriptional regulator [Tenacibaculum piscium]|uniref:MerR family transcriptional regulator n=1 Tax=Tenacibaculum piscium TaxID=1458515 RepID=UPI000C7DABB5|nr:MerR family transcriptional regulator [Tenacibaculum piscium]MBE7629894.1 MerR family transcriptional regulator [Tenacibaculum piscium]MBE7670306.1 MerR family transcriptional regulator [Tenacibaculum piscium]MBE7685852.1 MerR family transcriptional regulator [Tenacibaculum piscium]MBE7690458.1 MerR family transcriptional regulator [Tenacibaculum piscium]
MNNIKNTFTIKDLENISGIKAHTIRIWEKRYNLLSPERTDTNIRYYSSKNLLKLLNVVLLNKNNYKISKIAAMSNQEILIASRELALKTASNDQAMNSLKLAMFQFDKELFNNTYNQLLDKKTFREIFKDVFVPFLNHIGLLWQTDTLLPAHEHFISNLITQKIQISTERLPYNILNSKVLYVLFLPEHEIHELGLMYLNYELVLRGYKTIYLGQSLPLNNLNYFFESDTEIRFVTSLTVQPYDDKITDYFKEIEAILKDTKHQLIAIGAKTANVKEIDFEANISLYPSIIEFLKIM